MMTSASGPCAALGYVEGVGQKGGRHQPRGHGHHDNRVEASGQVEAQPVRSRHPAAQHGPCQHHQQQGRQDIQIGAVNAHSQGGQQPLREVGPDGGPEYEDEVAEGEGEESPEDERVADAGPVPLRDPLQHAALTEDYQRGALQALEGSVDSRYRASLQDQVDDPPVQHVTGDCAHNQQRQIQYGPLRDRANASGRDHVLRLLLMSKFPFERPYLV